MKPYHRSLDGVITRLIEDYLRLHASQSTLRTAEERRCARYALVALRLELRFKRLKARTLGLDPALFDNLPDF